MKASRPMFLDLTKIRFPLTAIISVLHRLTGILLFIAIPYLLYILDQSLSSAQSYSAIVQYVGHGWPLFFLWASLTVASYHLLAGIRHLLMDLGVAESFKAATVTAVLVLVLSVIAAILLGVWLW